MSPNNVWTERQVDQATSGLSAKRTKRQVTMCQVDQMPSVTDCQVDQGLSMTEGEEDHNFDKVPSVT